MENIKDKNNKLVEKRVACELVSLSKDGKTAKVQVKRTVSSIKYAKLLHRSSIFLADCSDLPSVKLGDKVSIVAAARVSKRKPWKLVLEN